MNASVRLFVNGRTTGLAARLAAGAGVCALLAGCVSNPFATAAVDPRSPIAADVARIARTDGPFPTFADIPPIPKDVRPIPLYGAAAQHQIDARARLEQETAPGTWSLEATDRFAARAEAAVNAGGAPTTRDSGAAEAFAREGQARATPPPSPR